MPRVALVGPRMHGQPMRARGQRHAPEPGEAWPRQVAPVAQHGDGIEIDGKLGGHGISDPRYDSGLYSRLWREQTGGFMCSRGDVDTIQPEEDP